MRVTNWPTKLALFIEEKRNQPFNWKHNNCGFFACDWIAMLVGFDPAAEFRPLTPLQLARKIRAVPVDVIAHELASEYNWPEVKTAFARRGDVVEIISEGYPALGVCEGVRSVFPGREGLVFQKTSSCRRAWRID